MLDLLEREAIVTRARGAVSTIDWQGAIRRWAEDYDQIESNTPTTVLEPRGLPAFENRLCICPSSRLVQAVRGIDTAASRCTRGFTTDS